MHTYYLDRFLLKASTCALFLIELLSVCLIFPNVMILSDSASFALLRSFAAMACSSCVGGCQSRNLGLRLRKKALEDCFSLGILTLFALALIDFGNGNYAPSFSALLPISSTVEELVNFRSVSTSHATDTDLA